MAFEKILGTALRLVLQGILVASLSGSALAADSCRDLVLQIGKGNLKKAEKIIHCGVSPSCVYLEPASGYFFPLQVAVVTKNKAAIDLLLKKGANLEMYAPGEYYTALHFAAGLKNSSLEFVKYLIGKGSVVDASIQNWKTPLFVAVNFHNPDSAEYLVSQGADPNAHNDGQEISPTFQAAYQGDDIALFDMLVKAGGKINLANSSEIQDAFTMASINCKKDMLLHMLSEYVSYQTPENMGSVLATIGDCGAPYGNTSFPGKISNPDMVPLAKNLVTRGANVKKHGTWALVTASRRMRLDLMDYLMTLGVDINSKTNRDTTALGEAIEEVRTPGYAEFSVQLLSRGANPNVLTSIRRQPALIAAVDTISDFDRTPARLELIRQLLAHGADKSATHNGKTALQILMADRNPWVQAIALF